MRRTVALTLLFLLATVARPGLAGRLESDLSRQLRGAWAIVEVEIYSGCSGAYFNNTADAGGVVGRGERRFEPGELVKIDKINLKRSRLDLFLSLAEPVLMGRIEGPFELYDERTCKVQLMVPLPRELVKSGNAEAILDRVDELMETAPSLAQAQASASWNQRQREDYPPDYELTLARYRVWQAEQINASVSERSARARDDALAVTARLRRDKDYMDGFVMGVDAMRSWYENDCPDLINAYFSSVADRPPGDRSQRWKEGFKDGQELVFNLLLADRLDACYVPVPALPVDY
jgi:hypothetical protein